MRVDPQLVNDLGRSSPEVKNIEFVESNLSSIYYVDVALQCGDEGFKKGNTWKVVDEIEERIKAIPSVITTESVLSVVRYMHDIMKEGSETKKDVLERPQVIPQLIFANVLQRVGRKEHPTIFGCGLHHLANIHTGQEILFDDPAGNYRNDSCCCKLCDQEFFYRRTIASSLSPGRLYWKHLSENTSSSHNFMPWR